MDTRMGSGQKVELKARPRLSWRLAQVKHARICEWNLFKIDHLLIVPTPG